MGRVSEAYHQQRAVVQFLRDAKVPMTSGEINFAIGEKIYPDLRESSRKSYISLICKLLVDQGKIRIVKEPKRIQIGDHRASGHPAYELVNKVEAATPVEAYSVLKAIEDKVEAALPKVLNINGVAYVTLERMEEEVERKVKEYMIEASRNKKEVYTAKLRGVGTTQHVGMVTTELICAEFDHDLKPGMTIKLYVED